MCGDLVTLRTVMPEGVRLPEMVQAPESAWIGLAPTDYALEILCVCSESCLKALLVERSG